MVAAFISLVLASNFPLHFTAEQEYNARIVVEQAHKLGEDPYHLMATAWVESRLIGSRVSSTGDYGIFQINYRFWARRWGFTDVNKFWLSMLNPNHATIAAVTVIREMRKYKTCVGDKLAACYNGGPSWQKSKNRHKILAYARKVNKMAKYYRRAYPLWKKSK
jgi:hypothetical protein